jgi:hypothetical protein
MSTVHLPRLRELRSISAARKVGTYEEILAWLSLIKSNPPKCLEGLLHLFEKEGELGKFFRDIDERDASGSFVHPMKQGIWENLRDFLIQRTTNLYSDELGKMDAIVAELYQDSPVADKLSEVAFCFIGPTKHFFYTLPSEYGRPVHLIAVPHGSIRNVWNWLVIPHEIGHDIFIDVPQLANEIEHIVTRTLEPYTLNIELVKVPRWDPAAGQVTWELITGAQLLREIWVEWSFELFPDLFSTLLCGPAYVMQLQEILRFEPLCSWTMYPSEGYLGAPDPHPVGHIRSIILTNVLRGLGFNPYADALEERLERTARLPAAIVWFYRASESEQPVLLYEVATDDLLKSGLLVAHTLLSTPLASLDQKRLIDLWRFSQEDQRMIEAEAQKILNGQGRSAGEGVKARHLLAATRIAYEREPTKAQEIYKYWGFEP